MTQIVKVLGIKEYLFHVSYCLSIHLRIDPHFGMLLFLYTSHVMMYFVRVIKITRTQSIHFIIIPLTIVVVIMLRSENTMSMLFP
jgi:hypothetical protein